MRARDPFWLCSTSLLVLVLFVGWVSPAPADEDQPTNDAPAIEIEEKSSSTQGRVTIDGQSVDYTVTVGDIVLRDDGGEPKAKMTFVSYLRDGVENRRERPVTFAFNGGPGSASVWVHLGAFGPKKAELDDEGMPLGPPPGRLVDNEHSVLDVTDLVFIDPVETGWSCVIQPPLAASGSADLGPFSAQATEFQRESLSIVVIAGRTGGVPRNPCIGL